MCREFQAGSGGPPLDGLGDGDPGQHWAAGARAYRGPRQLCKCEQLVPRAAARPWWMLPLCTLWGLWELNMAYCEEVRRCIFAPAGIRVLDMTLCNQPTITDPGCAPGGHPVQHLPKAQFFFLNCWLNI